MNLKSIFAGAAAVAVLGNVSAAVFVTGLSGSPTASNSADAGSVAILFYASSTTYNIDSLGVYAPAGLGGDTLTVKLWQEGVSSALASVDISSGSPDSDGFIYSTISTLTTASSGHYALTVTGYSSSKIGDSLSFSDPEPSYNGSLATLVTGGLPFSGANPYTTVSSLPSPNRFTIASFTATPVPEPEVYASIAGLALVGFGLYRRQVRK